MRSNTPDSTFARRVDGVTPKIIDTATIDDFLVGVQKRIQRERDRLRRNVDQDYKLKRQANIQRLQIIKEEMQTLRGQL